MKAIIVYLLFNFIFQMHQTKENMAFFRCGVDDHYKAPLSATHIIKNEDDNRRLNDGEFKDFHIYLDLINIKNGIRQYHLEEYENLFINSLNKAVKTLETLLKVKPIDNYGFTDENITNIPIDDWNKTMVGTNAVGGMASLGIDLIIFGKLDDEMGSSTLASAGPYYIVKDTGQPLVGIVYINTRVNYSKINSEEYFQSIIIHEFTHILGFVGGYFENYYHNIFTKVDEFGLTRYYINSTKVLNVARKYFNCSDIDGVELEESGGTGTAGSHWEARILLGEYMNGVIYPEEQVISEFTLALLEDTGFYKANYYTGGLMRYGKGKGCEFVKNRCVNSSHEINPKFENEFYDSIASPFYFDASCSSGRQSRTYYTWWLYNYIPDYYRYFEDETWGGFSPADYCPVAREYYEEITNSYYTGHCSLKGNGGYGTKIIYEINEKRYYFTSGYLSSITNETYSDHSFCYQSSLIKNNENDNNIFNTIRAVCYESFCSDFSLTIKIFDDYFVCPRAGGKIEVEGYHGYFICPDYNLICSGTVICNDMFDCVKKKSEIKEQSYIYDYEIKTSQNIENSEIALSDDETNYELAQNGICSINCKQCYENNICKKCRNNYGLTFVENNGENNIICLPLNELSIGYYKNNDELYYPCLENCDICSNDTICKNCSSDYIFINDNYSECIFKSDIDLNDYFTNDNITYYNCKLEKYSNNEKCQKSILQTTYSEIISSSIDDISSEYSNEINLNESNISATVEYTTELVNNSNENISITEYQTEISLNISNISKEIITEFHLDSTNISYIESTSEFIINTTNIISTTQIETTYDSTNINSNDNSSEIQLNESNISDSEYISENVENSNTKDIISMTDSETYLNSTNISSTEHLKETSINSFNNNTYTEYISESNIKTNYINNSTIYSTEKLINSTNIITSQLSTEIVKNSLNISSSENKTEIPSQKISTTYITNNPFFEIYILQVRIINKLLKIFIIISKKIEKLFTFKISYILYQNGNIRNLQGINEIELSINENNNIEPNKIYELTSKDQFNNNDRIIIVSQKTSDYETKVLNNNNKILDTSENEKMIKNGEMIDLSKNISEYKINNYIIKSSTTGCDFYLNSDKIIEDSKHEINLNFIESNNINNNISANCTLSSENNNKIPCLIQEGINNTYTLDSYIGTKNETFYTITPDDNEQKFELTCINKATDDNSNKKKSNSLSKAGIIIIVVVSILFVGAIAFVVGYCCLKRKKIYPEIKQKKDPSIYGSNHNIQESYSLSV